MSATGLRVLTIALFVAAAVFSGLAGDEGGPFFAGAFACFVAAVMAFFGWRRKVRASVFDREEKTSE